MLVRVRIAQDLSFMQIRGVQRRPSDYVSNVSLHACMRVHGTINSAILCAVVSEDAKRARNKTRYSVQEACVVLCMFCDACTNFVYDRERQIIWQCNVLRVYHCMYVNVCKQRDITQLLRFVRLTRNACAQKNPNQASPRKTIKRSA